MEKREIKFRSLYEGVWYYQTLEEILTITLAAFRNGKHKTQFTGLKDKNGKDIYEGDILQHSKVKFSKNPVVFEDGAFGRRVKNKYENTFYHLSLPIGNSARLHELEIIGNIYENPELLKSDGK